MVDKTSNSNDNALPRGDIGSPDAHGQASILLLESLIHGLMDRRIITLEDAIEIVSTASEVKAEVAEGMGDTPSTMAKSQMILQAISASLRNDLVS